MSKGQIARFNRVIIETTGLADPVPIIHTLMSSIDLLRIYVLDGVVTLVDATFLANAKSSRLLISLAITTSFGASI